MPGLTPSGKRSFTIEEKLEFVREYQACVERGSKVALLRRWNLDAEVGRKWVIAAGQGRLGPGAPTKRLNMASRERARLVALERENEQLRKKVAAAENALDIMGKAHELLAGTLESSREQDEVPVSLMSVAEYQDWLARYTIPSPPRPQP